MRALVVGSVALTAVITTVFVMWVLGVSASTAVCYAAVIMLIAAIIRGRR